MKRQRDSTLNIQQTDGQTGRGAAAAASRFCRSHNNGEGEDFMVIIPDKGVLELDLNTDGS